MGAKVEHLVFVGEVRGPQLRSRPLPCQMGLQAKPRVTSTEGERPEIQLCALTENVRDKRAGVGPRRKRLYLVVTHGGRLGGADLRRWGNQGL